MTLLQLVVLNACHFGPECHDFRSEHVIISMIILVVYGLIYKLFMHIVVGIRGPKVTKIGITRGDGYDVRIICVHRVLMLCSDTLLKGIP
jgi:hypothetical protein